MLDRIAFVIFMSRKQIISHLKKNSLFVLGGIKKLLLKPIYTAR